MTGRRRRKALGQHFLADGRVADRIIDYADPSSHESVLEIGPGGGVLTQRLAPLVRRLVAVEKDAGLARALARTFADQPHVEIHAADAARDDLNAWGPYDQIVANLPYSVSTPITFRILPMPWRQATLMYQFEFGQRLAAGPQDEAYGRLSAARAYFATAETLEKVPPGVFRPPPQVDSLIVRLRRHPEPPFGVASPEAYLDLLRVAFSTRRKTMRATLRRQYATLGLHDAGDAERIVEGWGHAAERPEEIPPEEFGRLSRLIAEHIRHA